MIAVSINCCSRAAGGIPIWVRAMVAAAAIFAAPAMLRAQPVNDQCGAAIPLSLCSPEAGFNTGAFTDGSTNCVASNGDVYFSFVPTVTDLYGVTLCGTETTLDFVASIHAGCPASDLNTIACNDDRCGTKPQIAEVQLTAGNLYIVRVAGFGAAAGNRGTFKLELCGGDPGACCVGPLCHIKASAKLCKNEKGSKFLLGGTCVPNPCDKGACCLPIREFICRVITRPECAQGQGIFRGFGTVCESTTCLLPFPPNDPCPGAIPIFLGQSVLGDNLEVGNGQSLPAPCNFDDSADVWYRFLPPFPGNYQFDTIGSPTLFDTTLAVFASCVGPLLACDDDSGPELLSLVQINFALPSEVFIRVGGFRQTRGVFQLNVGLVQPPMGACCFGSTCSIQPPSNCVGTLRTYGGDGTACPSPGIQSPCCPGDFNQSGSISVQDLFDFLAALFSGNIACDINNSGNLTPQDLFDFLAAYFTPC